MKLDELVKEYHLLIDEEGRYYRVSEKGKREEPYCTINTLAKITTLSRFNLRNLTKNLIPEILRPRSGPLCKYYNLNEVNCTHIPKILDLPRAQNGCAIINNEEYVSLKLLVDVFSICSEVILRYIAEHKITVLKMIADGSIIQCYPRTQVVNALEKLLSMPIIDDNGCAFYQNQRYASEKRLSHILDVPESKILSIIKGKNLLAVKVRTPRGFAFDAFSETAMAASLLSEKSIPATNASGIIVIEGDSYTTIYRLSIALGMHYSVVARRIKQRGLESKSIRSITGQLRFVYKIKDVYDLFPSQLSSLPIANKSGIVNVDGKDFATASKLHKLWGINEMNIKKRLQGSLVEKIQMKLTPNSPAYTGYNIDQAQNACSDLIKRKRRRSKLRIKPR